MRDRVLRDREHLENITSESALHLIKVDLGKVFAHLLFRGVIDQDIDGTESVFGQHRVQ